MFNKILLPVDGSDTCKRSYEYAIDLSKKYGSEIVILYVWEKHSWDYENSVPFIDDKIIFKKEYTGKNEEIENEDFKKSYGNQGKEIVDNKSFDEEYSGGKKEIKKHHFKEAYVYTSRDIFHKVSRKVSSRVLEKSQKYFNDNNIEVETRLSQGHPADEIIKIAESENFDLIIMCTHGMSAVKRFALGSVTNKVVHYAKTPVLVLRSCD